MSAINPLRHLLTITATFGAIILAATLAQSSTTLANDDATQAASSVYIIYDSSNSMWAPLENNVRKYEAARSALINFLEGDFATSDLAFRAYGHTSPEDCRDSELVVPFKKAGDAKAEILAAMAAIRPTGRTPIHYSLRQALQDFGDRSGSIILITDGIESCDADPCALLAEWRDRGIDINVHIVGLGLSKKEISAMQCMAAAAGTEFKDAQSVAELSTGLAEIMQTGIANPRPVTAGLEFGLTVIDDIDGKPHSGIGVLTPVAGGEPIDVATHTRYVPLAGDYILSAGIRTKGGSAYRPVTRNITIKANTSNRATITAPLPPRVSARFMIGGEPARSAMVRAYQNNVEVWGFNGKDSVFVDEGTYEFRSTPDRVNKELSVTESFAAGDNKIITFELQTKVRVLVKFLASGSGIRYKANSALYQNGEEKWRLHSNNGGDVPPGSYEIRFQTRLVSFAAAIIVTDEPKQTYEFVVPSGHVTIVYRDVDGNVEKPKRVKVKPLDWKRGQMRRSNEKIALTPATYKFSGWPASRGYEPKTVTLALGDDVTVELVATKD